jgi:hypothetical protein
VGAVWVGKRLVGTYETAEEYHALARQVPEGTSFWVGSLRHFRSTMTQEEYDAAKARMDAYQTAQYRVQRVEKALKHLEDEKCFVRTEVAGTTCTGTDFNEPEVLAAVRVALEAARKERDAA